MRPLRSVWNWLKSLFVRRDERRIFCYWDGVRRAGVDPITTYFALYYDSDVSLEKELAEMQVGDVKAAYEAMFRLDPLIRKVFRLPSFEGGGLTVEEARTLLVDFLEWFADVKKNGDGQPTLPEPTESESLGESTTSAAADSSPTPSVSNSANPPA